MPSEPQRLRDRLLVVATAMIVVAYAWLFSRAAEPELPQAPHVTAGVFWRLDRTFVDWREMRASKALEVARIASALDVFESAAPLLPAFTKKPLVIVRRETGYEKVGDDLIEISEDRIVSRRTLVLDLAQAWLLQRGFGRSSLFRYEVAADALASLILDESEDEPRMWLRSARPTGPLNPQLNPYSFRPFLRAWLLDVFDHTSPFARTQLLSAWASALSPGDEPAPRANVQAWKQWLRQETQALFPVSSLSKTLPAEAKSLAAAAAAVNERTLLSNDGTDVDVVYQAFDDRMRGVASSHFNVVSRPHLTLLYPDGIALESLEGLRTPLLVHESCHPAKLADFTDTKVEATHYLYLQACGAEGLVAADALARDGLYGLAKAAPELPFVQINREQTMFAVGRGDFDRDAPLTIYMERPTTKTVSMLGMESSVWQRNVKAYRVEGPIEAIEYFRGHSPAPHTSGGG